MNTQEDITIVIPCHNTEAGFLEEAINSVENYTGRYSYKIIVVDDGSTLDGTILFLNSLHGKEHINVIWQQNRGPASARNTGVKNAVSEFILLLDSDNRILPRYIDTGIDLLKQHTNAAAVYGNPAFLGDCSVSRFKPGPFNIKRLLLENYIDTCSVIRRRAWENVGGMDESREMIGHEDWEFWIHLYSAGWKLVYVNQTMYEYRIRKESVITKRTDNHYDKLIEYIYKKHWKTLFINYHSLYAKGIIYDNDRRRPFRSFIKYLKNSLTNVNDEQVDS